MSSQDPVYDGDEIESDVLNYDWSNESLYSSFGSEEEQEQEQESDSDGASSVVYSPPPSPPNLDGPPWRPQEFRIEYDDDPIIPVPISPPPAPRRRRRRRGNSKHSSNLYNSSDLYSRGSVSEEDVEVIEELSWEEDEESDTGAKLETRVFDWIKRTNELAFTSTISQDRTGGAEQTGRFLLSLLAARLGSATAAVGEEDNESVVSEGVRYRRTTKRRRNSSGNSSRISNPYPLSRPGRFQPPHPPPPGVEVPVPIVPFDPPDLDLPVPAFESYPPVPHPQGYPLPPQGYPPPPQGYPPPPQGYPPVPQGYPPISQGLPPISQGLLTVPQGYPPVLRAPPPISQGYPAVSDFPLVPGESYPPSPPDAEVVIKTKNSKKKNTAAWWEPRDINKPRKMEDIERAASDVSDATEESVEASAHKEAEPTTRDAAKKEHKSGASAKIEKVLDEARAGLGEEELLQCIVRKLQNTEREKLSSAAKELNSTSRGAVAAEDDLVPEAAHGEKSTQHISSKTPRRKGSEPRHSKAKVVQPKNGNVDWRLQFCELLGVESNCSDEHLLEKIHKKLSRRDPTATSSSHAVERGDFGILHRVTCYNSRGRPQTFKDAPHFLYPESENNHLSSQGVVSNLELYIEKAKGIPFLVFKDYECCNNTGKGAASEHGPQPTSESLYLISKDLCSGLKSLAKKSPKSRLYPKFREESEISKPYLWFYHDRDFTKSYISKTKPKYQKLLTLMFDRYILKHLGAEYDMVDSQLSKNVISSKFLEYIFLPETILLQSDQQKGHAYDRSLKLRGWPRREQLWTKAGDGGDGKTNMPPMVTTTLHMTAEHWEYDGVFQKSDEKLSVSSSASDEQPQPISDLSVFPIQRATEGELESLRERGRKFWECRNMQYVSYTGWDSNKAEQFTNARFMIDIATYKKMHADTKPNQRRLRDDLGDEASAGDPPSEDFLLLLPHTFLGFNMQEKKWLSLLVENVSSVKWNQEAFNTLVVDNETKDLIMALVTNKINALQSTDLMSGKGNGLIILLHGGPGTGKTLTAESVAEYTKKPLYRVTCGDIGTSATDVEKYLSSVLYLGKIWDCVVLLDEAEVFLQTRDLEDLQRNALVSVFLRVLEYYEGILILTSNRVATFDEAFKSRIQLSLHYEPLREIQRKTIWENFINRIKDFDEPKVDTDNLLRNIDALAKFDMNGRQIRNAVTTARQLAMFKRESLTMDTLRHVIKVSSKFDNYLKKVNDNLTDEEIARDAQYR